MVTDVARPLLLGIESSCDDTACAVVDGQGRVLSSVVSSQLAAHRPFGGVVPEIASRQHLANWSAVSAEAVERAGIDLRSIDAVAATGGPGLVGSLMVGLTLGKAIAWGLAKPFFAVHHLEGHLYSPFLRPPSTTAGPAVAEVVPDRFVGLIVSGGHTTLVGVERGRVCSLAETRDDAIGEAFDKLGKRMGLPYPQGPVVDELAERGRAERFPLPVPSPGERPYFSYSGLKTQTLSALQVLENRRGRRLDERGPEEPLPDEAIDLLAGFRAAAVRQLVDRLERLHRRDGFEILAVSGGVAANLLLRRELASWASARSVDLRLTPLAFAGDNAAMVGYVALLRIRRGDVGDALDLEARSRVPFDVAPVTPIDA
jgi:N6-L-threonylcarbamoyladenine synthase